MHSISEYIWLWLVTESVRCLGWLVIFYPPVKDLRRAGVWSGGANNKPPSSQDASCSKSSCLRQLTEGNIFCQCRRCSSGAPVVLGWHPKAPMAVATVFCLFGPQWVYFLVALSLFYSFILRSALHLHTPPISMGTGWPGNCWPFSVFQKQGSFSSWCLLRPLALDKSPAVCQTFTTQR